MKRLLIALCCILVTAGCASYEPLTVKDPKELNKGEPGAFSGEDGVFTLYGN